MKISQIMTSAGPADEDLPPLQSMILEELIKRQDEVFEYNDQGLLRIFSPHETVRSQLVLLVSA